MKPISLRFWLIAGLVAAAYVVAGHFIPLTSPAWAWVYKIGLCASTLIAMAFIGFALVFSLLPKSARMWRSDLGASVLIVMIAILPFAGGLAWTFLFDDGDLRPGLLAWLEISGPVILAGGLTWVCFAWFRFIRAQRRELIARRGEATPDLPVVAARADRVTGRPGDQQHGADDSEDDAEDLQEAEAEQETDDREHDSEDNHDRAATRPGRAEAFRPGRVERPAPRLPREPTVDTGQRISPS